MDVGAAACECVYMCACAWCVSVARFTCEKKRRGRTACVNRWWSCASAEPRRSRTTGRALRRIAGGRAGGWPSAHERAGRAARGFAAFSTSRRLCASALQSSRVSQSVRAPPGGRRAELPRRRRRGGGSAARQSRHHSQALFWGRRQPPLARPVLSCLVLSGSRHVTSPHLNRNEVQVGSRFR